jgi:hypothetical protein
MTRNTNTVVVVKYDGKDLLKKSKRRRKDNIKKDLKDSGPGYGLKTFLQHMYWRQAFVSTVKNFWIQ